MSAWLWYMYVYIYIYTCICVDTYAHKYKYPSRACINLAFPTAGVRPLRKPHTVSHTHTECAATCLHMQTHTTDMLASCSGAGLMPCVRWLLPETLAANEWANWWWSLMRHFKWTHTHEFYIENLISKFTRSNSEGKALSPLQILSFKFKSALTKSATMSVLLEMRFVGRPKSRNQKSWECRASNRGFVCVCLDTLFFHLCLTT